MKKIADENERVRAVVTPNHPQLSAFFAALGRFLVAGCAVLGLCLLVNDSLKIGASFPAILLPVLLFMAVNFLLLHSGKTFVFGLLLLIAAFGESFLLSGLPPLQILVGSGATVYNAFMARVEALGFLPLVSLQGFPAVTSFDIFFTLAFLLCPFYSLPMRRKVRLLPLLLFSVLFLSPFFAYNMPDISVGFCLLLAALTAAIAMRVGEKRSRERAHSGLLGLTALLLAGLLLLPSALLLTSPWRPIPAILNKIEPIRQLLTMIAEGKSVELLGEDGTAERDTTATPRRFSGKKILDVAAESAAPLYLREWIGAELADNKWTPPEDNEDTYRMPNAAEVTRQFLSLFDRVDPLLTTPTAARDLGLTEEEIFVLPHAGRRIIPIPTMLMSNVTSAAGGSYPGGYSVLYDGIYLTNSLTLPRAGSYSAVSLRPDGVRGEYERQNMRIFLDAYHRWCLWLVDGDSDHLSGNALARMLSKNIKNGEAVRDIGYRYASYVASLYREVEHTRAIEETVVDLFEKTDIAQYFKTYPHTANVTPSYLLNGTAVLSNGEETTFYYLPEDDAAIYAEDIADTVAEYLAENYAYSLNPPAPTSADSVEEFLLLSREGYCVQFATAATLLFRRLGYSARYVEGYIAHDFTAASERTNTEWMPEAAYTAEVHDNDAHAWVEIWVDGYGWMTVEVTPPYRNAFRPSPGGDTDGEETEAPVTEPENPEESEPRETDERLPEDTNRPLTTETEEMPGPVGKSFPTLPLILLATGLLLALTLFLMLQNGERKRRANRELLEKARKPEKMTEEERKQTAEALCRWLEKALAACGLTPKVGEMPTAFATRADEALEGLEWRVTPSQALMAVQRQVYGGGMEKEDFPAVAEFLDALAEAAPKKMNRFRLFLARRLRGIL